MIIEQIRMEQIQTYKYLEFEEGKQRVISVCEAWWWTLDVNWIIIFYFTYSEV